MTGMAIMSIPKQYTEENSRKAPDAPGTYEILDDDEDTIYIGRGAIRQELLDNLPSKSGRIHGATYYRFEITDTIEQAVKRQIEELDMHIDVYGRLPAFNQKISA